MKNIFKVDKKLHYQKLFKKFGKDRMKFSNIHLNLIIFIIILIMVYMLIITEIKNKIIIENPYLNIVKNLLFYFIIFFISFYKNETYILDRKSKEFIILKFYLIMYFIRKNKKIIKFEDIKEINLEKKGNYTNYKYLIYYQINIKTKGKLYKIYKNDNRLRVKEKFYCINKFFNNDFEFNDNINKNIINNNFKFN